MEFHSVNCSSSFQIKEVFKFLAVSLMSPTVLCIVVAVLHLNVYTSSSFVLVAQVMSTPVLMQTVFNYANASHPNKLGWIGSIYIATVYGPWNLDFFRALYRPTCMSPTLTTTQSYIIDGAIGPLVLLVVLYLFITLRDRGCRVIVKIWKPFHFYTHIFRLN